MYDTDRETDEESDCEEICCVPGCDVQTNPDIPGPVKFHKIPSRPLLLDKWMKLIGRRRTTLPSNAHVCSLHFESSCYSEDDRGRKCLKRSAVPTIKPVSQTTPSQGNTPNSTRSPAIKMEMLDASMDDPSQSNSYPEGTQIVVLDRPSGEIEQSEASKSSRKIVVLLPAATDGGEPLEKSDSDFDSEIESSPLKARMNMRKSVLSDSASSNVSKLWRRNEEPAQSPSKRKTMKPGPNSRTRRKVLKPKPKSPPDSPKRPKFSLISQQSQGNEAYQLKKRIVELEKDNVMLQKIISTEKEKTKQLRDRVAVLKQAPKNPSNSRVIIAHVRF